MAPGLCSDIRTGARRATVECPGQVDRAIIERPDRNTVPRSWNVRTGVDRAPSIPPEGPVLISLKPRDLEQKAVASPLHCSANHNLTAAGTTNGKAKQSSLDSDCVFLPFQPE